MQSQEYHSISDLKLVGDMSPVQEEETQYQVQPHSKNKVTIALEVPKNKVQRRKRSIQIYTDSLYMFSDYLNHKFHHDKQENNMSPDFQ